MGLSDLTAMIRCQIREGCKNGLRGLICAEFDFRMQNLWNKMSIGEMTSKFQHCASENDEISGYIKMIKMSVGLAIQSRIPDLQQATCEFSVHP